MDEDENIEDWVKDRWSWFKTNKDCVIYMLTCLDCDVSIELPMIGGHIENDEFYHDGLNWFVWEHNSHRIKIEEKS